MNRNKGALSSPSKRRVFCFILIIMQSLGIRFVDNQGIALSIAIMILSYRGVVLLRIKDFMLLSVCIGLISFCKVVNPIFLTRTFFFQIALVISAYLFLVQYRDIPAKLQNEFFLALKFFFYHALAGYVVYLLMPSLFSRVLRYKTLGYVFWVDASRFGVFPRNTGLLWEPGVLQLLLNMYLFFCIKFHKSMCYLAMVGLCVMSCFSTAGFIILFINILFSFIKQTQKKKYFLYFLIIGAVVLAFPIISTNVTHKMSEKNTSGQVRRRDIRIGIDLIKEKPVFGHGIFSIDYLRSKKYVTKAERDLFSEEYLKQIGEMSGGYTNGLLGLVAWYGVPVSFLLYLFFYKNRFVDDFFWERLMFFLINMVSFIGEPITYTAFFLLFPFSYLIFRKQRRVACLS